MQKQKTNNTTQESNATKKASIVTELSGGTEQTVNRLAEDGFMVVKTIPKSEYEILRRPYTHLYESETLRGSGAYE